MKKRKSKPTKLTYIRTVDLINRLEPMARSICDLGLEVTRLRGICALNTKEIGDATEKLEGEVGALKINNKKIFSLFGFTLSRSK